MAIYEIEHDIAGGEYSCGHTFVECIECKIVKNGEFGRTGGIIDADGVLIHMERITGLREVDEVEVY